MSASSPPGAAPSVTRDAVLAESDARFKLFRVDAEEAVSDAHEAGGYTAVLTLAEDQQLRAGQDLNDIIRGREDSYVTALRGGTSDDFTFDEKVYINVLQYQRRYWDRVQAKARPMAANESLGWTPMPDGTSMKMVPNGQVLSFWSGVSCPEDSGDTVDTSPGATSGLRATAPSFETSVRELAATGSSGSPPAPARQHNGAPANVDREQAVARRARRARAPPTPATNQQNDPGVGAGVTCGPLVRRPRRRWRRCRHELPMDRLLLRLPSPARARDALHARREGAVLSPDRGGRR
jgi:hypothetical protein